MSANPPIVRPAAAWPGVGRWLPEGRRALRDLLTGMLPTSWQQRLGLERRRLQLCLRPGGWQLQEWRESRTTQIGAIAFGEADALEALRVRLDQSAMDAPRWLVLDGAQVLVRSMVLPAASEAHLQEVMGHEIDRQTPFGADQVCFEGRIVARDPVLKQLRAELVVLPKSRLDAALSQLGPLADGLAGVDAEVAGGGTLGVNLLPMARRAPGRDHHRWLNFGLALGFVLLVYVAMLMALGQRRAVLLQYQQQVGAATTEAREARKLGNLLVASTQAENFLAGRRVRQPTTLELLADVTRRLPDTTWLEKISVNDGNIVLIGQSQQASALVGLLQASSLMTTPALAGSVQTDPRTGKERFTLTAKVASTNKEAASASNP